MVDLVLVLELENPEDYGGDSGAARAKREEAEWEFVVLSGEGADAEDEHNPRPRWPAPGRERRTERAELFLTASQGCRQLNLSIVRVRSRPDPASPDVASRREFAWAKLGSRTVWFTRPITVGRGGSNRVRLLAV